MHITSITPKQTQLLLLLYRYRFLTSLHLQKFLNHKSHTLINHWLTDLVERNIIGKIDLKKFGIITSKPSLYYLGLKSRVILSEMKECRPDLLERVYQEKRRSVAFRQHALSLADLYFQFLEAASKQRATLQFFTKTDIADFAYAPLPFPDAYLIIKGEQTHRYFLELIDGAEKWFVVDRKIKRYISYYQKEYWQNHVKVPFPSILVICPNVKLQRHLQLLVTEELERDDVEIAFFFSIHADIQERGIQPDTWKAM
ncbi:MAG: replication-relaxation family protein [Candidatus Woesebacteria bacterium]